VEKGIQVGKKVCLSRKIFSSRVTGFVFVTADDDYVVVNIRIYCVPSDLFFFFWLTNATVKTIVRKVVEGWGLLSLLVTSCGRSS